MEDSRKGCLYKVCCPKTTEKLKANEVRPSLLKKSVMHGLKAPLCKGSWADYNLKCNTAKKRRETTR